VTSVPCSTPAAMGICRAMFGFTRCLLIFVVVLPIVAQIENKKISDEPVETVGAQGSVAAPPTAAQSESKQLPDEPVETVGAQRSLEPLQSVHVTESPKVKQNESPKVKQSESTLQREPEKLDALQHEIRRRLAAVQRPMSKEDELTELEDLIYSMASGFQSALDDNIIGLPITERNRFKEAFDLFNGAYEGTRPQVNISIDEKLMLLRKSTDKVAEYTAMQNAFNEKKAQELERRENRRLAEVAEQERVLNITRVLGNGTAEQKKQWNIRDTNDTVIELEDECYSMFGRLDQALSDPKYNISEFQRRDFEEGRKLFHGAYQKAQSGDLDKNGKILLLRNATKKSAEYHNKTTDVFQKYAVLERKREEEKMKQEEARKEARRLLPETPEERRERFKKDSNDTVIELEDICYSAFGNVEQVLSPGMYYMSDSEHKEFRDNLLRYKEAYDKTMSGDVDKDGKVTILRKAVENWPELHKKLTAVRESQEERKKVVGGNFKPSNEFVTVETKPSNLGSASQAKVSETPKPSNSGSASREKVTETAKPLNSEKVTEASKLSNSGSVSQATVTETAKPSNLGSASEEQVTMAAKSSSSGSASEEKEKEAPEPSTLESPS